MRAPLRFSVLVGCAIFGIGLVDMIVRPPDTVNGTVVEGDNLLRVATAVVVAAMGFAGSAAALRFGKPRYLSYRGVLGVAVLYAICMYLPAMFAHTVTVQIDNAGHIEAPSRFWWSLIEPFALPRISTLQFTHLSLKLRAKGS
jgi:hypothetical protein